MNNDLSLEDTCSHVYEMANGDIKLVVGCLDLSIKAYNVKTGKETSYCKVFPSTYL